MADDNSSTFSSLSPSPFQHQNVVLVHDHELQLQQQQSHKLLSNNFVSGLRKRCVDSAVEVADYKFIQKEYMFDKVVTPSDIGKLNRLVIPKRDAEKYFPSTANHEKGLLLSFEDRNGKPWTFRYCYWNSSQSYVMTKGWSRFVKEKRLDAGDIVYFGRGATQSNKDRYYIDWKHQPYSRTDLSLYYHHHLHNRPSNFSRMQNLVYPAATLDHLQLNNDWQQHHYYQQQFQQRLLPSTSTTSYGNYFCNIVNNNQAGLGPVVQYVSSTSSPTIKQDCQAHGHLHQQAGLMQHNYQGGHNYHSHMEMILNSVPVVPGKAATKGIRLFGVNLECLVTEDA